MKARVALTAFCVAFLCAQGLPAFSTEVGIYKFQGQNIYELATAVSEGNWSADTVKRVYLANGQSPIDAKIAADFSEGPLLFTEKDSVNPLVLEELKRLKNPQIVVVGNESSVPDSIAKQYSMDQPFSRIIEPKPESNGTTNIDSPKQVVYLADTTQPASIALAKSLAHFGSLVQINEDILDDDTCLSLALMTPEQINVIALPSSISNETLRQVSACAVARKVKAPKGNPKLKVDSFSPSVIPVRTTAEITVMGPAMDLVENAYIGDKPATILQKSEASLKLKVPTLETGTFAVKLQGRHGEDTETVTSPLKFIVAPTGLEPEHSRGIGDPIVDPSGSHQLILRPGGDLVQTSNGTQVWSAKTAGLGGKTLKALKNGNVVLLDKTGKIVWQTNTAGFAGAKLVLQEDGDMLVRQGNHPLWSKYTEGLYSELRPGQELLAGNILLSENREYRLSMERDGNLVLSHEPKGKVLWASRTKGSDVRAVMSAKGNLEVVQGKEILWTSSLEGKPGTALRLQNDGNLVLHLSGEALWNRYHDPLDGVLGDDYPQQYKDAPMDELVDDWSYFNRECTSFVAWRLNDQNGIDFNNRFMGASWGDAYEWKQAALASDITVDDVPARGAVAWTSAGLGHVAWVSNVSEETVTIEEYNNPGGSGLYSVRTVPIDEFEYIHVGDL